MPRSRGLTIYVGLQVAATGGTLAAVVALQGAIPAEIVATVASMILGYFQSQFLAAWIVLGSAHPNVRWGVGALAMFGVLAPPWIAGTLADGAAWFTLKIVAGTIVLPAACVAVGLAPELFGGRRIRFVGGERIVAAPPQFSLRGMFVVVVLAALLIGLGRTGDAQCGKISATGQVKPGTTSPPVSVSSSERTSTLAEGR